MHGDRSQHVEELVDVLRPGLSALVRHGSATPSDVIFETPEMLHALRGLRVEGAQEFSLDQLVAEGIKEAADALPATQGNVAKILLGLDPSARGCRLGLRRELAAEVLNVKPETFRIHKEASILDALAQQLALALLSPPTTDSHQSLPDNSKPDLQRVLLIHRHDSFGLEEVKRLLESFGLRSMQREEALEQSGFSSPSVIDSFRACLAVAQAVVVILEGGLGKSAENLLFEAGLAIGLAQERTVIVQLGDQPPPENLRAINILRLRDTAESREAFQSSLQKAGCEIGDPTAPRQSGVNPESMNAGWFRWAPDKASSWIYADLAKHIEDFAPLANPAGHAAAKWLREESLPSYPSTITHLLMGSGRVEGFIAIESGEVQILDKEGSLIGNSSRANGRSRQGASFLRWIARHQDSDPGVGRQLLTFAVAIAQEVAEKQGSIALVIDSFDAAQTDWMVQYEFLHRDKTSGRLWMPIHSLPQGDGDSKFR